MSETEPSVLLENLAGGGIGATVLGVCIIFYKMFQKRGCHSKSGCISVDVSTPHDLKQREHFIVDVPTTRTPVPSLNLNEEATVSNQKENLTT